ncbi:DUF3857 domain-containing protein [Hymenobacter defluvii]|uniref:DUF3857 domain-containing protein n=1 Tax=Hymenobacter defluvii TaxID=2054411 RepID=A0ABS3THP9_9BACT|nr:DUF3857 domain-containing protein [Hymenobacter defluvii]MBO3273176.1 DUF3857 domain-containing protein [Hymenobacter defluvii]
MRRFILNSSLLLGLLCNYQPAAAQKAAALKPPISFGDVSAADFGPNPTPVAADSAAEAEVLCDYGQSRIVGATEKFQVVFDRTTRIHILRKAGYEWATVRVPLYVDDDQREKLSNLKGFTYNMVGGKVEKTKLDPSSGVFSEKIDKNHVLYSFTLPNVKEGSVVEFTYTITSDFLFNLQDWQFQHSIPTRWSEYRVTLPSFFRYKEITHGYLPFAASDQAWVPYSTGYHQNQQTGYGSVNTGPTQTTSISTQALAQRWVLQNAPAFREEPFMAAAQDYMRSVHFELAGSDFTGHDFHDLSNTWEKIGAALLADERFGVVLNQNSPLATEAKALRTRLPDARARAEAVLRLVQQHVKYNGQERLYTSQPTRKTYEQHQGNSADVNLLLLQTLRAAELSANPVLLSTRTHGRIVTDMPLLSQFNYTIAHVVLPDGELLLDATEPLLPMEMLPERCLNEQGRLLTTTGAWVPLTSKRNYLEYTKADFKLDDTGTLRGTMRQGYSGYAGLAARQQVFSQGESSYKTRLGRRWTDWQLTTPPTLLELEDPSKAFAVDLAMTLPGPETPANTLYLPLMQAVGLNNNPFRHADRFFPVDFSTTRELTQVVSLALPARYTVQEKPADLQLALPGNAGKFLYHVAQPTPDRLEITSRLQLTKTSYSPAEYAALREFYSRAIAKHAEMLVLQRQ